MNNNQDIVVHLIHGTFDERRPDMPHWSDPGGMLAEGIKAWLPEDLRGRVKFEPFDWSGKNSFEERKTATGRLASIIDRSDDRLQFLIGHSHGGTIIADALVAAKEARIVAAMTLATPFVARMLDASNGRLAMALYAPVLAFWIALSGALAFAVHQVWIGAGLCLAIALFALFGFSSNRAGRCASILGAFAILLVPLALIAFAFWNSNPLNTFPAMVFGVLLLTICTGPYWTEWTDARTRTLSGIPSETELPNAPSVPLTALRLPGDEASFAIVTAQAIVWFETKRVLGTAMLLLRRFHALLEKHAALTYLVIFACSCGLAVLTWHPNAWWKILLGGAFLMIGTVALPFLFITVVLLWLRVLTTVLLAHATGVEVLYGIGAISVYAEPLPRWKSHAHCHLEILGWTEEDAKQMPPLRHSMHRLGFVHQRVADWIVERLKQLS